jgi:hypothetical protein
MLSYQTFVLNSLIPHLPHALPIPILRDVFTLMMLGEAYKP